jgi:hypothetical protein
MCAPGIILRQHRLRNMRAGVTFIRQATRIRTRGSIANACLYPPRVPALRRARPLLAARNSARSMTDILAGKTLVSFKER